jgi:DNA-binding FadR family transcriptional regulator
MNIYSEFFKFLASHKWQDEPAHDSDQVPSLAQLSEQLNISVSSLREQLEAAKALGFVEVRPRTGIRRLPYSFLPAVRQSLGFALQQDRSYFASFSDLRNHLEAAYWYEAVSLLTPEDEQLLIKLEEQAQKKLHGSPIRIPHREHRQLHLTIFGRLDNLFVKNLLEAYWEAYETAGLNVFADLEYLQTVWEYHRIMVEAICRKDYEAGFLALVEHKELLYHRPETGAGEASRQMTERSLKGD